MITTPDRPAGTLGALSVAGHQVAAYDSGEDADAHLGPRPFLHPLTTLGGTTVTDTEPEDHAWHLGVSMAVQDVAGNNLWGGRTCVRGRGYVWRDDHGAMRHRVWRRREPGALEHEVSWLGHDGGELVREVRSLRADALDPGAGWTLTWSSLLHAAGGHAVALGGPGTNGKPGSGYGGLFWRVAPARDVRVFTAERDGERDVHGHPARWLALTATTDDGGGDFTLVFEPADDRTAADPWFVRVEMYPGVCSALAFDEVLTLRPAAPVAVQVRVHVLDGRLDRDGVAALLTALRSAPAGHPGPALRPQTPTT